MRLEAALGASAQSRLTAQLACDLYEQIHSPAADAIKRIRRVRAIA
jgi:hypothetical protein